MTDLELGKSKLQAAFLEISKNYLENLELAPEEDVSFSPKLERKMVRLLKAHRNPCRNLVNTPFKRAIAACLALLIFTSVMISCNRIREPIIKFSECVYEKFVEFFFGAEAKETAPKIIEEVRMPTYVPEGYELVEQIMLSDQECQTIWRNEDNIDIHFYQAVLTMKTTFDIEQVKLKTIDDGSKITLFQKGAFTFAFWNDNHYSYTLIGKLSMDEMIKMIQSMKKI